MPDEITELLKSIKAAKDLLPPKEEPAEEKSSIYSVSPPKPDQQGERKVSLGDAAKRTKDYEREPFEKK